MRRIYQRTTVLVGLALVTATLVAMMPDKAPQHRDHPPALAAIWLNHH